MYVVMISGFFFTKLRDNMILRIKIIFLAERTGVENGPGQHGSCASIYTSMYCTYTLRGIGNFFFC